MDDAPVELLMFEDTFGFSSSLPPSGLLRLPMGLEAGSPANHSKIRQSNICLMCFSIMCKIFYCNIQFYYHLSEEVV